MFDGLENARKLATMVRFSGDTLRNKGEGNVASTRHIRTLFAQTGLQVNQAVTPSLASSLKKVYEHLHIPAGTVDAFVFSSPEIQAECYAGSTKDCVIQLSSGLIDLLDSEEIEFVAGHEIGHFLLKHGITKLESYRDNIEFYMQQRSQEISADRIGLLACRSLDIAIRALMKTVSGLTSKHLRFDVATFTSQLRNIGNLQHDHAITSSHPSILVRCRALLWFSLNDYYTRGESHFSKKQMQRLDNNIENDLAKFVDGPSKRIIEEAKQNLSLWMAAYEAVQNGVFNKKDQANFSKKFGEEMLNKLKNFIDGKTAADVQDEIFLRMQSARQNLENIIPHSFEAEYEKIKKLL